MKCEWNGKLIGIDHIIDEVFNAFPEVDRTKVTYDFWFSRSNFNGHVNGGIFTRGWKVQGYLPDGTKGKFDYPALIQGIAAHEFAHIASGDLSLPALLLTEPLMWLQDRCLFNRVTNPLVMRMERRADRLAVERGFADQLKYTLKSMYELGNRRAHYEGRARFALKI